ncbi:MAG: hypothetical protein MN733_40380, partial [Nitrososphaera sp.]|nr:hypothetical protein [Nitrososphaera sp.]
MPEFSVEKIDQQILSDPEMKQLAEDDPTEFDSKVAQIYHEFGYRPDGSPLPVAQRASQKLSQTTGISEGLLRAGLSLPIPTATTLFSGAAGTAAGGPGAGTALGMMFGSLAGEEINARLGITDPLTPTDQAIALGAPLLGPAVSRVGRAGKGLLQRFPGAQAGVQELAGETFEASLKKMRVSKSDVEMFRNVVQHAPNVKIRLPMLDGLLKEEQKSAYLRKEFPGNEQYIDVLNKFIEEMSHGPVSMRKILEWERGANLAKVGNPTEVWGKMAGTILDDMDNAVLNPKLTLPTKEKIKQSSEAFKRLVQVTRKYNADEALDGMLKRVVTPLA